jgi:hypothetical protein
MMSRRILTLSDYKVENAETKEREFNKKVNWSSQLTLQEMWWLRVAPYWNLAK